MAAVVEDNNRPHLLIATLPIAAERLVRGSCRPAALPSPPPWRKPGRALACERFTLAIVGVYFDGARMFELMSHLRISPLNRGCPIVCVLGARDGLPPATLAMIRQTVNVMESCEFLDMSALPDDEHGNAEVLRRLAPYLPPAPPAADIEFARSPLRWEPAQAGSASGGDVNDTKLRRMKWLATGLLVLAAVTLRGLRALQAVLSGRVQRGRHGRRDRRLVRGGGAVPPAAQPADPAHRDHPAQQGAHRARALRVHPAEFPQRARAGAAHRRVPPGADAVRLAARAGNADIVAGYATRFVAYALGAVDDERVRRFLHHDVQSLLKHADFSSAAAGLLDILTESKRHHALLDAALAGLDDLLAREDTRRFIAAEVAKSAPLLKKLSDWLQLNLDERAALKIVELAIAKVHEVRATATTSCAASSTSSSPGSSSS